VGLEQWRHDDAQSLIQVAGALSHGHGRSPSDRLYDTIYTERYLGLPDENPEQYKEASPLSYVGGLRGDLLVVHGSGDDNVHFQNSEALINALVAADKQFTMMDYPNRTHCICEGENTSRHLYGLLTRYLQEHLPASATRAE